MPTETGLLGLTFLLNDFFLDVTSQLSGSLVCMNRFISFYRNYFIVKKTRKPEAASAMYVQVVVL